MYKLLTSAPITTIVQAVREYRDIIAPTYGPAGKGVLIANGNKVTLVDDGQMASQAIEVKSELHNAVISYIKEAAAKTNSRVGDGTTTSIILMADIVLKLLEEKEYTLSTKTSNRAEVVKLQKGLTEAVAAIKKAAKKIKTKEELYAIAYNSYNNEAIATLIADLVFMTGEHGVVTVEESQSVTTESSIVEGLEIDRGYASPYLAPTPEIKLKSPNIILALTPFNRFIELAEVLKEPVEAGRKEFVVVAESFADEVIAGVVVNNARGTFNVMLVQAPSYGDHRTALMKDLSMLTGATILDPKLSKEFTVGTVERVLVTKSSTTFIVGKGTGKLKEYAQSLLIGIDEANAFEKERLEQRAAALLGGIGVIRVGANTEAEMLTMKAKVDDAVHATQAALRSGVVAGAGVTYAGIKTTSEVLNNALKAPQKQLEENGKEFLDKDAKDPAEVLIAALESAVSIATGLLTTGAIVAEKREEKEDGLHF